MSKPKSAKRMLRPKEARVPRKNDSDGIAKNPMEVPNLRDAPEFVYKFTDGDAMHKMMDEGIFKFGDVAGYREAENSVVCDPNENSLISEFANIGSHPRLGNIRLQMVLLTPGNIFCASTSEYLSGHFGHQCALRIEVRPFWNAIFEAVATGNFFVIRNSEKVFPKTLYERSKDGRKWVERSPKDFQGFLGLGAVRYEKNLAAQGLHPADILRISGGDAFGQFRRVAALTSVKSDCIKHAKFSHEQEYRLSLNFVPSDAKLDTLSPTKSVSKVWDVRGSVYVKLRNCHRFLKRVR